MENLEWKAGLIYAELVFPQLLELTSSGNKAMLPIRQILVPIDWTELSNRALKLAASLAREHNAKLVILYVVPLAALMYGPPPESYLAHLIEELSRIKSSDSKTRVQCLLAEGVPEGSQRNQLRPDRDGDTWADRVESTPDGERSRGNNSQGTMPCIDCEEPYSCELSRLAGSRYVLVTFKREKAVAARSPLTGTLLAGLPKP